MKHDDVLDALKENILCGLNDDWHHEHLVSGRVVVVNARHGVQFLFVQSCLILR